MGIYSRIPYLPSQTKRELFAWKKNMEISAKKFAIYFTDEYSNLSIFEIPMYLLAFFGHFHSEYEKTGNTDFWHTTEEVPLTTSALQFLVNTFTRHYETHGKAGPENDEKLENELATLPLIQLYDLLHICDLYKMPFMAKSILHELMRRLLRMTPDELRSQHTNYDGSVPIITSVVEAIVPDCLRQSLLLDILRRYVRFRHLFELIRDRYLPRADHLLATGMRFFLVITALGVCGVGDNKYGQLAHELDLKEGEIYRIGLDDVISVAAGIHFSLFLTSSGDLYSVGGNYYGQLGRHATGLKSANPEKVVGLKFVLTMSCGSEHAIAITSDGVYMWGHSTGSTPKRIPIDERVIDVSCCNSTSVLLCDNGTVYLSIETSQNFVRHPYSLPIKKIVCQDFGYTVLLEDGRLYAWGRTSRDINLAYGPFAGVPAAIKKFTKNKIIDILPGMVMAIYVDEKDTVYMPLADTLDVMRLARSNPNDRLPIKHLNITDGGVIDACVGVGDRIFLGSDGLYYISVTSTNDAYPYKYALIIGHEQYANDPTVAKSIQRRTIEYKETVNLGCYVCDHNHIDTLFLNPDSSRLFCGYSCLCRYKNLL